MLTRRTLVAISLIGFASASCQSRELLAWPLDVRAAADRGPRIRPPEDWSHPDSAAAFHARGWDALEESWRAGPARDRARHCWRGTVRPVAAEAGDVVPSDLSEHGLEAARFGETSEVGELVVASDDRTLSVCETRADVGAAVSKLGGECPAFGQAIDVVGDGADEPPHAATLTMDALRVRLTIRWPTSELAVDRLTRRLGALGFRGEVVGAIGEPPRLRRIDDGWTVEIDLPPDGVGEVELRAVTELPRRPLCGPPPRPPRTN